MTFQPPRVRPANSSVSEMIDRATLFAALAGFFLGAICVANHAAVAGASEPPPEFHQQIEPILVQYCYECHGLGEKKADVAFDELKTDEQLLNNRDLWFKALKNVRAGIMPPKGHPKPSDEEQQLLRAGSSTSASASTRKIQIPVA